MRRIVGHHSLGVLWLCQKAQYTILNDGTYRLSGPHLLLPVGEILRVLGYRYPGYSRARYNLLSHSTFIGNSPRMINCIGLRNDPGGLRKDGLRDDRLPLLIVKLNQFRSIERVP